MLSNHAAGCRGSQSFTLCFRTC